MRRAGRWALWLSGLVLGLPALALALLLVAANTQPGREWAERTVSNLGQGETRLAGLSGRFPDALRLARLELRDANGAWLAIDQLALDWSPLALLEGELSVQRLEAARIRLDRLPSPAPEETGPAGRPSLPVAVRLESLRVARLELAEAVAGKPASLAVEGRALLVSLERGEAWLNLRRLEGEGAYTLQARLADATVSARLSVREPAQGLLGSFAGIQELDALALDASVEGPLSALQTRLELNFGPLQAQAHGQLDIEHEAIAGLAARVVAPAMRPRPGLSWQSVTLDAQIQGRFTRPSAQGELRVDRLEAAGAAIRNLVFKLQGDAGQAGLRGEITGLRLPGLQPGLLEAAPLSLQADVRLDAAERPVVFKLKHPLLSAEGKALTAGELKLDVALGLPDLRPYAALGGQDVQGRTNLNVALTQQNGATRLAVDGSLALTGGAAPWPALLGGAAKLGAAAVLRGEDLRLERLQVDGKALSVSASGTLAAQLAQFDWKLALNDLAAVLPGASGRLAASGRVQGPLDKFTASAELDGELATKELARGPLSAKLRLEGLPREPAGEVAARGMLGGSPLELALSAKAAADGSLRLSIARAGWKSAQAKGDLTLPKGAELPLGKIELAMGRLDDLRPLTGQPLTGALDASLETGLKSGVPWARLQLDARQAGLAGTAAAGQTRLDLTVADPVRKPVFDGRLSLDGIEAGQWGGGLRLDLAGPLPALDLRLAAHAPALAGAELKLDAAARLDAQARQLALAGLQADWKGETLRLLAPARVDFKDGVAVDRLRLGLRQAVLEVAGQLAPRLKLDASLRGVSADLAEVFVPGLAAGGNLSVDARLAGPPGRPVGRIELQAEDLQMKTGPARGLPPLRLAASADLAGASARLDARLGAVRDINVTLAGEVPLDAAGPFDLQADGSLDLKLLDAWLGASGRRMRGQLALNGGLAGTLSEPKIQGSVRLEHGEAQDYAAGAHIGDITALAEASGGKIRLVKLQGRAGPGTVSATGELDLLAEGMPVSLALAARDARPLASDRLTAELDADLAVQGQIQGALAAAGKIRLRRVEIRIPENLPAGVAVLKVRRPGDAPSVPPPPADTQEVALNLTIDAPGQIFVRGRGLDAELGGTVHVRGTAAKPQPDGGFELRRGEFSLAGQSLVFSKGKVSFDGAGLADPSLDFLAKTEGRGVTAYLGVAGHASKPKITLSSTPELPQDEVLAQLLFGRASASLSPLELAQIATALASLTGATSGLGNPLDSVRKTLGLDRLSVGASLEAGRYVAPGVYIGTKQAVTGGGTQATAQIDIAKGLKLEGAVGTGAPASGASGSSGANSVGVVYEYEY